MAEHTRHFASALKEFVMRYYPAAIAIALLAGVSASVGYGATADVDPRVARLIAQGRDALAAGNTQEATDAFEAALVIAPGHGATYLDLARAARQDGLQGKAIHYYREALVRDPRNFAAISGEGEAMVEKGAIEKARRNLAQLETLCGDSCVETRALASKIATGPKVPVLTADAVTPDPVVTQN